FHVDTGNSMDECMQLGKQIEEMIKSCKLSQFIKDLKQNDKLKAQKRGNGRKGQAPSHPDDLTMGKASQTRGHPVLLIYVDGGASSEVLYEHCLVRLRPEIRSQMIPATTSLIGFSGETIWPLGQISLLVKVGDEEHSTSAWMNFMVIRSPSQHNGIIGCESQTEQIFSAC
ncbi:hypothetical protein Tco_0314850, partial [Tanacetum coccineum]